MPNVNRHTLSNGDISIAVKNTGAELMSLRSERTGIEYLWQGNPASWQGQAPVLFPIVGRLKDDAYTYRGRTYRMNQHGLARTMAFEPITRTATGISFRLRSDERTLKQYPFTFELTIAYTLDGNTLRIAHDVTNPGNETMLFSIGAHPGFRCPLEDGERYEDYHIELDRTVTLDRHCVEDGLIAPRTEPFLRNQKTFRLSRGMFDHGAIVFKDIEFSRIGLRNHKTGHGVTVDMEGFPYLGIWAARGADFICLEPWHGIADGVGTGGRLEDKEGIIALRGGDSFRTAHAITPG